MQVVIYLFLIERVHIVRGRRHTRLKDKLYLFHLGGLLPYCVIVIFAIIFRVNELNDTRRCYIGLQRKSSLLLLIYDLVINVIRSSSTSSLNSTGLFDDAVSVTHCGVIFLQARAE